MVLLAVAATALGASATWAASAAVPRPLVGTWTIGATSSGSIAIRSNGHAVFHIGSEVLPETVSGTRTTVTFGAAGLCAGKGTYAWKIAGRTLTFRPMRDACTIRSGFLKGTWKRK
jgi:hypothetical protein